MVPLENDETVTYLAISIFRPISRFICLGPLCGIVFVFSGETMLLPTRLYIVGSGHFCPQNWSSFTSREVVQKVDRSTLYSRIRWAVSVFIEHLILIILKVGHMS